MRYEKRYQAYQRRSEKAGLTSAEIKTYEEYAAELNIARWEKMYETYKKEYDKAAVKQKAAGYSMASSKLSKEEYKQEMAAIEEDIKHGRYRSDTSHLNRDLVAAQSYELTQKQARSAYQTLKKYYAEKGEEFDYSPQAVRHMSMKGSGPLRDFIKERYAEFKKDGKIVWHGKEYKEWQDFMGDQVVGSPP